MKNKRPSAVFKSSFLIFYLIGYCLLLFSDEEVSFAAVGDVLLDRGIRNWIERERLDYPFENVADYIKSKDLAFCNLECPVSLRGKPLPKPYNFRADKEFLSALNGTGFDILSLANNHTLDYGREALLDTLFETRKAGFWTTGAGRNRFFASLPLFLKKNGICFAFFASTQIDIPAVDWNPCLPGPWNAPADEIVRMVEIVRPYVDYVIVSIHWGVEYSEKPNKRQIKDAHRIMNAGADLIIGHHSHSIQGVEKYKKGIILYSLSNFLFDQHQPPGNQSIIFECIFTKTGIKKPALIPVVIRRCQPNLAVEEDYNEIAELIKKASKDFNTVLSEKNGRLVID